MFVTGSVKKSDKTDTRLVKTVEGELKLKYKTSYGTSDYENLSEEKQNELKPNFAFIGDFFVSAKLLEKFGGGRVISQFQ